MHQAKTELSKLIAAMEAGERVLIKRGGKPVAQLTPVKPESDLVAPQTKRREVTGSMKGYFQYTDDAFDPLPDDFWEHNRPDTP